MLDFGHGQKLEKFGAFTLIRPEATATNPPHWNRDKWDNLAHAQFIPRSGSQRGKTRGGHWEKRIALPEAWQVEFPVANKTFEFRVSPTTFGHVGLFPEQYENWQFIAQQLQQPPHPAPKVLNLFAYTGAASVVARAHGAEVYHVDSSRPVLNQARQNMELNNLSDIRWVHEDAFKFVRREARRARKYSGIVLDPPPAGRGPSGERWTLDTQLDELLQLCAQILEPGPSFLVMSLYALDWPHTKGKEHVAQFFRDAVINSGDCHLLSQSSHLSLNQGTFARATRR